MTRANVYVLLIFFGVLTAVIGGLIAWDVWLKLHDMTGDTTISWSMTLLGFSSPGIMFVLGHLTGGVLWGLIAHWFFGLPSPEFWDSYLALQAENTKLQAENAELRKQLGPAVDPRT